MSLEDRLEALSLGPKEVRVPNSLPVRPPPSSFGRPVPKFQQHKCLGKFRTTGENTCSSEADIPRLISKDLMERQRGKFLGAHFKTATLIKSYAEYHNQKQKYFLDWIISNEFFSKVDKEEVKRPNFISFGGRITDPMMTPGIERFGDFKVYAAKFNDSVYLWSEKKVNESRPHTLESYYGIGFEHMLTSTAPGPPNEYDKVYVINEVTFGSHQLLCLNEVDAVDEKGDWVELKVYRKCSPKGMAAKYLKYWAQSVVPGVEKLLLAERDDEGRVVRFEETTSAAIARQKLINAHLPAKCYEFEDRLLNWINKHFKENNPKIVKIFSWSPGQANVSCVDVKEEDIPSRLLPDWYVEKAEAYNKGSVSVDDAAAAKKDGEGEDV